MMRRNNNEQDCRKDTRCRAEKGEEYSKSHGGSIIEEVTYGRGYKSGYIEGYNQAMQDFMEKACEWLEPTFKNIAGYNCGGDLINNFKTYIKDEM